MTIRPRSVLLCAALATMLGGALAPADAADQVSVPVSSDLNETAVAWFVELASPPTAAGTKSSTVKAEKDAFRANARKSGVSVKERYAFDTLWNGLSVTVAPADVSKLRSVAGVKAIWPVATIEAPERPVEPEPELQTALAMTGADNAQSELGFTGAGVRVAVMDTGIDYDHEDLGGCFGAGCRVVAGWDFVGDAFNADPDSPSFNPVPVPDGDPDDCNGHGTHVAGIVGAQGEATGVAPGATFGAYRVFGCEGSTTADIMIAAMERALKDGMHILNMSIGSAFQWPQYPTAVAADNLVKKGVTVVASIGNSGANGLYSAGAPGLGKDVIGVASFDNSHVELQTFTITPDSTSIGYGNAAGAPAAPTSGSLPMARTATTTPPALPANDACAPLGAGSLTGNAVLIRRGTCTFHAKALNAQNAGAAAVVLYNNVAGRLSPTVAGSPAITIPVVAISDLEGVLINGRLAGGAVTMTWTANTGTFVNPTGGLISSFSSYGLSPDLSLKPDIGGPGGLIRSTYPLEQGGYATISGTSMSSPHVAGGAALILQARPGTPVPDVRTLLQNSADPKNWWGNPGLGFLDNVHRQGAGMADIDDAILATAKIEPSKLALGESEAGSATRRLTIRNDGDNAVTFNASHTGALATGPNTFTPAFTTGFAAVAFSPASINVPAGGSASVDVTITANAALADKSQYGGYLVFTPAGGGQPLRVPYAGFKGDYQSIQVLVPTANGFPWLARLTGENFFNQPGGATYTLVGDDVPFFLVHLDHQSQRIEMQVLKASGGTPVHPVFSNFFEQDFVGRNSTATGFFAFTWDGARMHDNGKGTPDHRKVVPDGQYVVRLKVLKALGDPNNAGHWETWNSPVVTLDRP